MGLTPYVKDKGSEREVEGTETRDSTVEDVSIHLSRTKSGITFLTSSGISNFPYTSNIRSGYEGKTSTEYHKITPLYSLDCPS